MIVVGSVDCLFNRSCNHLGSVTGDELVVDDAVVTAVVVDNTIGDVVKLALINVVVVTLTGDTISEFDPKPDNSCSTNAKNVVSFSNSSLSSDSISVVASF